MKEELSYIISLLKDPEYNEFREDVKNFREKWLNSQDGFKYSKGDLELIPPLDINENSYKFIWWREFKGYPEDLNLNYWQSNIKEDLYIDLLIEDIYNNEELTNYKKYEALIKYEWTKKEDGMFEFLERITNSAKIDKELMKYYNLFQLDINYKKNITHLKKWIEKLKFKSKEKKINNELTEMDILKYELYLESLIYNQKDKYDILESLSKRDLSNTKNSKKNKIYSQMFGYEDTTPKIAGYKTRLKNKKNQTKSWINVKIDYYNTGNKMYNEFISLMNKWSFEKYIISANYGINSDMKNIMEYSKGTFENEFERRLIEKQPFYLFLNNCILFDMNKIKHLTRFYRNTEEKELINLNGLVKQYVLNKSKLYDILKLLDNDDLDKKDIIDEIESEGFKKKNNSEKYSSRGLPIFSYMGELPTQTKWLELHEKQKKLGNTQKGSQGVTYSSMLEFYKWYIEIEKYNINVSTIKKRDNLTNLEQIKSKFNTYCKKFNLKDPFNE